MKEEQDTILYLPGDSKESIKANPMLKRYVQAGYEVLLLPDPIDEFCVQNLAEYEKRKVKSIASEEVNLLDNSARDAAKNKKLAEMYKPLTTWFQEHLGTAVKKVTVSGKLGDTPLFIFTQQYGYSAQMEKINKAQAFMNKDNTPNYMNSRKTLELNPHHPVMRELLQRVKDQDGALDEASTEYADLLFQMALLDSGFETPTPAAITAPLEKLIRVGFGVDRHAEVVEIELELDEEEDTDDATHSSEDDFDSVEVDLDEDDAIMSDEL